VTFSEQTEQLNIATVTLVNVHACQMLLELVVINARQTIGKSLVVKVVKLVIAMWLELKASNVIR
jgi:hypothetical protein